MMYASSAGGGAMALGFKTTRKPETKDSKLLRKADAAPSAPVVPAKRRVSNGNQPVAQE